MTVFRPYDTEDILHRMRTIAEAEMMVRGTYIEDEISDEDRIEAPCGGHQACAVGSLVLAAGFHLLPENGGLAEDTEHEVEIEMSRPWPNDRHTFMVRWPQVGLAYDLLNDAAATYIHDHDLPVDEIQSYAGIRPETHGWMESLFESALLGDTRARNAAMVEIIGLAQDRLEVRDA